MRTDTIIAIEICKCIGKMHLIANICQAELHKKLMFKVILKLDRTITRALNFISIYNYIRDTS